MANKRFVKPISYTPAPIRPMLSQAEVFANQDAMARSEYRYCLAEAKRAHPEWTLAQRQNYARNAAQSLFE